MLARPFTRKKMIFSPSFFAFVIKIRPTSARDVDHFVPSPMQKPKVIRNFNCGVLELKLTSPRTGPSLVFTRNLTAFVRSALREWVTRNSNSPVAFNSDLDRSAWVLPLCRGRIRSSPGHNGSPNSIMDIAIAC